MTKTIYFFIQCYFFFITSIYILLLWIPWNLLLSSFLYLWILLHFCLFVLSIFGSWNGQLLGYLSVFSSWRSFRIIVTQELFCVSGQLVRLNRFTSLSNWKYVSRRRWLHFEHILWLFWLHWRLICGFTFENWGRRSECSSWWVDSSYRVLGWLAIFIDSCLRRLLNFEVSGGSSTNWRWLLRCTWHFSILSTACCMLLLDCGECLLLDLAILSCHSLLHTQGSSSLPPAVLGLPWMIRAIFALWLVGLDLWLYWQNVLSGVVGTWLVDEFVHFVVWEWDEGDCIFGGQYVWGGGQWLFIALIGMMSNFHNIHLYSFIHLFCVIENLSAFWRQFSTFPLSGK